MTTFDLLALGAILVCLLISASRGVFRELVSFLGWIIALIFARFYAIFAADVFLSSLQPRSLAVVIGFVLCYIACRLVLVLVAHLLDFTLKTIKLSALNRVLGASIGFVKGVLLVSIVVLLCSFSTLPEQASWKNALTAPWFEQLAALGLPYLPDFLQQHSSLSFRQPELFNNRLE